MTRNTLLSGLAVTLSIMAATVAAQSAHVHGEGRVNIAIEDNQIFMSLESPGADIVGFEHEARSSDEKAAVASAIAQLGEPMQLLRFEADAACELLAAKAKIEGEEHDEHKEHDEHEGEQHDEHDEHEGEKHDEHEEHDEHEGEEHDEHEEHGKDEEAHGAFVAEYEFECANIDALSSIEFTYFNLFTNAQSLDIVLIDSNGQHRKEIDRANPVLQLKE